MERMTNEKKAKEVANVWKAYGFHYATIYKIVLESLQWKDEQFAKILDETYEMRKEICRSNVSFADCTELIQRIRKKLEE